MGWWILAGSVLAFFSFFFAGTLFWLFQGRRQMERRVASLIPGEAPSVAEAGAGTGTGTGAHSKLAKLGQDASFKERVIRPFWLRISRVLTASMPKKTMERLEARLKDAGYPFGFSAADYLLAQTIVCLMFFGFFFWLFMGDGLGQGVAIGLMGAGAGVFYSRLFLVDKRKQRIVEIERAMPDFFDMVNVSLEAGMGVDGALTKVCRRMEGPLSQEFLRAIEDMKLGKSRREAFSDLRERVPSELFQSVMSALIQADQFGIGLTKVLRSQTRRIRESRRQAAREKAMKAPVKMLIPMVLFIFPTLFVVILGPLIVKVITEWL